VVNSLILLVTKSTLLRMRQPTTPGPAVGAGERGGRPRPPSRQGPLYTVQV
jgi:hypothetical protein